MVIQHFFQEKPLLKTVFFYFNFSLKHKHSYENMLNFLQTSKKFNINF